MADGVDTSFYKDAVSDSPLKVAGDVADYRNKLLGNVQNEQAVQANNIKLATERFGMVNNAAAGLLSDPELGTKDVTKKLWDTLGRLTKGDAMSAQHAVQFMQQFPQDPKQQAEAIKAVHAQTLSAWERGKAYLGTVEGVSTGGGTKFVQQPAYGGAPPQDRGYIPNTLTPGTQQVNPDLSQSYVGGTGNPAIQGPAGAPAVPARGSGVGGARTAPSAAPATQKPVMAAPAPGAAEAKKATGEVSGASLASERVAASNYRGSVLSLEKAIPALEKLGTSGTGPGTETINHLKSFLVSNMPGFAEAFKGAKNEVEQYDIANKYLVDFVNQNGNTGTNDKLAAAFSGNPSTKISNAAATDVAKTALSLRKMRQAQLEAFGETGLPEDQFGAWASKWNRQQDPRVYAWDYMDDSKKKALLQSMTGAKRDHFIMAIHEAADKDFINPESLSPSKKK